MNRRDAVKVLSVGAACSTTAAAARVAHNRPKEALDAVADLPPRKVIVATYGRDLDPACVRRQVLQVLLLHARRLLRRSDQDDQYERRLRDG